MIQSLENLTGPPTTWRLDRWEVGPESPEASSLTAVEQALSRNLSLNSAFVLCDWGKTRTLLVDRYFLVYKVGCQSSLVTAAKQMWRHPEKIVCADYKGLFVIIERGGRGWEICGHSGQFRKTVIPGSVTSTTENSRHVSQMIGLSCNGSRKP